MPATLYVINFFNTKIEPFNLSCEFVPFNISSSKIIKLNYDLDKYISKLERVDILIDKKQNNLEQFQLKLEHNNPKKISSMGYSKIFQNNQSVSSVKNVKSGNLIISMIDGQIETNYKG